MNTFQIITNKISCFNDFNCFCFNDSTIKRSSITDGNWWLETIKEAVGIQSCVCVSSGSNDLLFVMPCCKDAAHGVWCRTIHHPSKSMEKIEFHSRNRKQIYYPHIMFFEGNVFFPNSFISYKGNKDEYKWILAIYYFKASIKFLPWNYG